VTRRTAWLVEAVERTALAPGQVDAIAFDVVGTLVDEDATWSTLPSSWPPTPA